MMKGVRKILLLLVTMLGWCEISAQSFYWEGILFEVMPESPKEVRLYKAQRCMANLAVPDFVEDGGEKYAVTTIGEEAFRYLDCISEINFNGVKVIEDGYVIHYSDNNTDSYYGSFAYCTNIKRVLFGEVEKIGDYAFYDCQKLESVDMQKIKDLGIESFRNCCSLKNLLLGAKMKSIGENCFLDCEKISKVCVESRVPPRCALNAFDESVFQSALLLVPVGTKAEYMNAEGWNRFVHIQEEATTSIQNLASSIDKVKLEKKGDILLLRGIPSKTIIQVYDTKGRLLQSHLASGNAESLQLPVGNVYLVKVGECTHKVAM